MHKTSRRKKSGQECQKLKTAYEKQWNSSTFARRAMGKEHLLLALSEELEGLRQDHKLTNGQLARRMGCSVKRLKELLNPKGHPRADTLPLFAAGFAAFGLVIDVVPFKPF